MKENDKLKITLQFALQKIDEAELNWLLNNELSREEKIEILQELDEDRIKEVLRNVGLEEKFIDSL